MALLLRAITHLPDRQLELDHLMRVDAGDLTAWATELHSSEVSFGRADLLEHHRVVNEIFARFESCLPARFPAWFEETQLRSRHAELADRLQRLKGHCEFAVTGVWFARDEIPTPAKALSGRQYLAQRQRAFANSDQRLERANQLADELERSIGDYIVDVRRRVCPSPSVAFSVALLMKRTRVDEIRARLDCPAEDVRILVNGPWPPYSFAGIGPQQGDG